MVLGSVKISTVGDVRAAVLLSVVRLGSVVIPSVGDVRAAVLLSAVLRSGDEGVVVLLSMVLGI